MKKKPVHRKKVKAKSIILRSLISGAKWKPISYKKGIELTTPSMKNKSYKVEMLSAVELLEWVSKNAKLKRKNKPFVWEVQDDAFKGHPVKAFVHSGELYERFIKATK
jgi:hypothetical protein